MNFLQILLKALETTPVLTITKEVVGVISEIETLVKGLSGPQAEQVASTAAKALATKTS